MIEGFIGGLSIMFSWPTIIFLIIGSIMGLVFGLLPGLQGSLALATLIPVTFGMDMYQAIPLLIGAWGASEGSATAILFNIPGEGENAATMFDGYPLAQQGRAGEALGAAGFSSLCGVLLAILIFIILLPIMRPIVLAFGPPEFCLLAILGLCTIAVISKGNIVKGLFIMCIGMLMALHGTNPITGGIRYTFGTLYLWEGVPLLPTLIGLFGLTECLKLLSQKSTIVRSNVLVEGGVLKGIRAVIKNWKCWGFGACLGTLIGAIPGVGGSVASYLAYSSAVTITGRGEKFGNGNIKGVIAPEASNNAKDGGALMPALILGIPGSVSTAIMITALILHGIYPGRELITNHLELVFLILQCLAFANMVSQNFVMFAGKYLARLTIAPPYMLVPVISTTCLVGAFTIRHNIIDVALAGCFSFVGYFLDKYNFPKIGILMGLILTPLAERSFHSSIQISDGSYGIFVTRPGSLTLIILILFVLLFPLFFNLYKRLKK
jgi:putative tricarboxylic transport membrane protein